MNRTGDRLEPLGLILVGCQPVVAPLNYAAMECIKTVMLTGANRWAPTSVIEAHVEFGAPRRSDARQHDLARARLLAMLPVLERFDAQASRLARQEEWQGERPAPRLARELENGGDLARVLLHLTQLLQAACGVPRGFGATFETDDPAVVIIVFEVEVGELGGACLEAALAICEGRAPGDFQDPSTLIRRLVDLADDVRLGPSSRAIVRAATARGIPHRRLNRGSLVQFGEGCRQRRTWTAETDATSAIAESIAQDKELTKRMLRAVGVPVPLGRPVSDPEDAWRAALEIGLPVVVKPRRANHARGISLNLTTREQVLAAHDWAVKDGDDTGVLVEQYALGQAHRLLVVGNRLIAAARGESEFVVGDGRRTVRELVDEVNRDPRRGENYTDPLTVLKLDDAALLELGKQSLTPESVPESGERVLIQPVGDLTTDCTSDVHPSNADKAVLAARAIGLDIAGLDVVAQDIRVPLEQQRGAILEVNAGPSLSMHVAPLHGHPQPVGAAIIDQLFPSGASSHILLIAVGGVGDRSAVARQIDVLLRRWRHGVALATSEGFHFDGVRLSADLGTDFDALDGLLLHPRAEVGIWECHAEQTAARGLGYGRCDIAVVTGLPPGMGDIDGDAVGLEPALAEALALAHAVPPEGFLILPLDSPWSSIAARATRGKVVCFADEPESGAVHRAVEAGASVVHSSGATVSFVRREGESTVEWEEQTPSRRRALLAAWAAAWSSGQLPEQLTR